METPVAEQILQTQRQINRVLAIIVGGIFMICVVVVIADIVLRQLGSSLGGTDEISGYVMAIGTAWGMAFAMMELSHVRIDFLRTRFALKWRCLMDLFAMFALSSTVSMIAIQSWPVVATTLKNGSRANTPLETPLAIVQIPWFLGWAWFALMAWLTFAAALMLLATGKFGKLEPYIGIFPEVGEQ